MASARECGPGRGQGDGEGGARAGRRRGAHEVGVMRGIWAVHVRSLRAGEGRAHQKGDASGGGGERGRAGGHGAVAVARKGEWRHGRGSNEAPDKARRYFG